MDFRFLVWVEPVELDRVACLLEILELADDLIQQWAQPAPAEFGSQPEL